MVSHIWGPECYNKDVYPVWFWLQRPEVPTLSSTLCFTEVDLALKGVSD